MKKMIKKVTVLLLAFVLLLNICACGSEAEQKTQETEVLELEVEEQTAETENEEADQAPLGEEAKFTPEKDISFIVGFVFPSKNLKEMSIEILKFKATEIRNLLLYPPFSVIKRWN